MKCPSCEATSDLCITCYPETKVYVDEDGNVWDSDQIGGCEWDDESECRCTVCDWSGCVKDTQESKET